MALLSNMVPIGTELPDVALPALDGDLVSLRDYAADKPLLVVFTCNHCPYVRHVEAKLGELTAEYADRVATIAISSNDVEQYPDDDAAGLASQKDRAGWHFPYLIDDEQAVATIFNAACTPDFFLFDANSTLAYRGAFDHSTPKNGQPLTGELLRAALEATINGEPVPEPHKPSMGCGIKWKPGNEPATVIHA